MAELSLVAARAFKPMIGAASLPTLQLERLAERAGLCGSIIDNPTGIVPLHATEHFMDLVHRKVGNSSFLFNSLGIDALEKRETHAVVGIPLPVGVTGIEALQALSSTFNNYITGARFYCEIRDNLLWVKRTTSATEWSDAWSILQYNLSIILLGARRILGRNTRPVALCLPQTQINEEVPDELRELPIIKNKDGFGVAFDMLEIAMVGFTLKNTGRPATGTMDEPMAEDRLEAFASCLSTFVTSSTSDKLADRVSHAFGCSPRSYRRQLAQLGTSHSKLMSDVRLDLALTLLEDGNTLVADVAVELGYAHSGDFTRFFKNRMGCSPVEYRKRRSLVASSV
jgi:AraC-like DNA-binding protein